MVLAGIARFGIEFIRVNEAVAGPFTLAQLISAGVTIAGVALLVKKTRRSA
jgi:prolipoprotein diacylglyceryltransferase